MIYIGIWFIGAIIALLAFKWAKGFTFRTNLDADGSKILAALIWPAFVIIEVADMISTFTDHVVDKINHSEGLLHKVAIKLGNVYRKYL
ncbi:hypothetical protein AVV44_gp224 [Cronobacter phage S13]|jgi:hypothetical protein|uniref:Uncharacterized protein n=1 Tax=Cronobacter phage LPCS28 TaxID=2924885 RepID=A0AAE9K5D5_9CAUD|nr:hypothetical protein AVV44_gp224 [Cronobacter phage S13]YP_010665797.1 hypothetical protein PQB73_gp227 [Cronobacter phage LPCS28]AIA65014.1 hypothetical protein S13_217 [Cronobacter phage S13]UNY46986.1 hypothetical protein EHEKIMEA_00104 [Cronobacter phage LPCS28]